MSDKLYTYPIDKLLKWILAEEKTGRIFGYYKNLFFESKRNDPFKLNRYGKVIDTPLGVAAGPHTQLSQNIILSWLFGARYIELKTVQVLDNIEVGKPCIDMADEGYNCEWSQELLIEESYDQYVDAWIILHILSDKYEFDFATIFNISVGYDLDGIKSDKVSKFLSKMKNAEEEIALKIDKLSSIYPRINGIDIPVEISNNVTLSTMHGCPPDEIESIARYLMEEWNFHTAVKLNPTLLGKENVRDLVNTELGYEVRIPDAAFEHDINFNDAKRIINRLLATAKKENVEFGIKLTNTLESINNSGMLPGGEEMVYMSGRALHPVSISTAAMLQQEFKGNIDISFSGGADAFNFADIIACNLKPVTVCSDLLKPGGYSRLHQYIENLTNEMHLSDADCIENFILKKAELNSLHEAGLKNLINYAGNISKSDRYKKASHNYDSIKTSRDLTRLDCIHPPCVEACAISQDVPEYLYHAANENFGETINTILKDNALPNITGQVCDHLCQTKCTRINIDNPLQIREVKRYAAEIELKNKRTEDNIAGGHRVAVIGAGPSGLSAAYILAKDGIEVDVFEAREKGGGMAFTTIPVFRISDDSLSIDIEHLQSIGVKIHFDYKIDRELFDKLLDNYDFVYLAVGAQKGKKLNIQGEEHDRVIDQIDFLESAKHNQELEIGKSVAVIGGGNSAMDAARTAKRLVSRNNGQVTVVYRRTINEMPADKHEVEALLEEGITVYELTAPESIEYKNYKIVLNCIKMQLADADESGRRRPVPIPDSEFTLEFDYIITAIGQEVVMDFLPDEKIVFNTHTKETNIEKVFAGGDFVRGADSLINAMADGKEAAENILAKLNKKSANNFAHKPIKTSLREYQVKLGKRVYGENLPSLPLDQRDGFDLVNPLPDKQSIIEEASRCLYCDEICNMCVSVCPNLANYYYEIDPVNISYPVIEYDEGNYRITSTEIFRVEQQYQIFNINDFCNECGNCDTFCPTSGAPYKIKPRFCFSQKSFDECNEGYYIKGNKLLYKNENSLQELLVESDKLLYCDENFEINFTKDFELIDILQRSSSNTNPDTRRIVELYFYFINLNKSFITSDF